MNTVCVPTKMLGTLCLLTHLIFITTPWGRYRNYLFFFPHKWCGFGDCPRSLSWCGVGRIYARGLQSLFSKLCCLGLLVGTGAREEPLLEVLCGHRAGRQAGPQGLLTHLTIDACGHAPPLHHDWSPLHQDTVPIPISPEEQFQEVTSILLTSCCACLSLLLPHALLRHCSDMGLARLSQPLPGQLRALDEPSNGAWYPLPPSSHLQGSSLGRRPSQCLSPPSSSPQLFNPKQASTALVYIYIF